MYKNKEEFMIQKPKGTYDVYGKQGKTIKQLENLINALMEKYKLSEEQAKSVLAMRLSSLAHMEKIELENEKVELMKTINSIEEILSNRELQIYKIKDRLTEIVKKYGDARRTELLNIEVPKEEKEIAEIIPEDVVIVFTENGLIKKVKMPSQKDVYKEVNAIVVNPFLYVNGEYVVKEIRDMFTDTKWSEYTTD